MSSKFLITVRHLYLYAVSGVSVVIMVVASIGLIHIFFNEYVFDVKGWEELQVEYYECEKPMLRDDGVETRQKLEGEEYAQCVAQAKINRTIQHTNSVKEDLSNWLSMLLVAIPVYLLHWRIIRKEK